MSTNDIYEMDPVNDDLEGGSSSAIIEEEVGKSLVLDAHVARLYGRFADVSALHMW